MKSTRDRILQTLLKKSNATINELAKAVGINAISVRHHLTSLQAENLVDAEEQRHGVGRPRLVYFLTESGREKFPSRYLRLTNRLLDELKTSMPEDVVVKIFKKMGANLAVEIDEIQDEQTLEEKLDILKTTLEDEGFSMDWEKTGSGFNLIHSSCPYYHIGQAHPEVCALDQSFISTVLSVPVEKISCILSGDSKCIYKIEQEVS